uniref:COMM domain-containing protein 5-like n=1 Tax=Saccoglossus kowalevskii TaxID=10224 RepID=A0ABM0LY68_SACKO|nr:PREDICTED: COMM domain-containing protein 5-like [Saccoglossus kowalevskii]
MSVVNIMPPGRGAIERTSFLGSTIPKEVKSMVKLLPSLDKDNFRQLLRVAVSSMEGNEITEEVFHKALTNQLTEEKASIVYSGICTILKCALRLPQTSLKTDVSYK